MHPDLYGQPSAAVLYTSRFGTTEKVARALGAGLKRGGLSTVCVNVDDVNPESLGEYDLLCFGGPTEFMGLSKKMDEFIEKVRRIQLQGKPYFAFDTKTSAPFTGSAAKCIHNRLEKQGLSEIARRESAIVRTVRQGSMITGNVLKEGEEARFERIGYGLASTSLAKLPVTSAAVT